VYAPLAAAVVGADINERFCYLFACMSADCRNTAAGWRVLRAQRPAPPPPAASAATTMSTAAALAAPAATVFSVGDDWGAANADDWGGGGGGGFGAASGDAASPELDDLAEALRTAQLSGAAADAAAAAAARAARADAATFAAARTGRPPPSASTLPEFYVAAVHEPGAEGDAGGADMLGRDATSARAAQLAAEYACRAGGAAGVPPDGSGASASAGAGESDAAGGEEGDDTAGESWGGEAYERVTVRGVDRAYLKFQKRLRRCPAQCVRCARRA
jgi:hypothetical protein